MSDVTETIDEIAAGLEQFKADQAKKFDMLETKLLRPGVQTAPSEIKHLKTASGLELPVLRIDQKAADLCHGEKSDFSLGQYCKDAVCGSTKAASGPALVPTMLSSQVIDLVRSQSAIAQSGAKTIFVDNPTLMARLTQDPTVFEHTESVSDISESDILAEPVTMNPKILAALVPLTAELVQDSANLDEALNAALAGAFSAKLDELCIATLLADTAIPKSTVGQDPAVWAKVLEAVGSALAANQGLPDVHISSTGDFIARAGQLAATAGSWLGKPPALASMKELHSTGLTAGTALFGDFFAGFAVVMRAQLRFEIVRHQKPTSATHLLVAHMRASGVVLQPGRLFKQLKTV